MCIGMGPKLKDCYYPREGCHHSSQHRASDNYKQTLKRPHVARQRLVIEADAQATKRKQVDDLREWLRKFGDIFKENK
jgi:hypothetical protein